MASSLPTRSCASTSTRTCRAGDPIQGQTDKHGKLIEDRIYNQKDFDRSLVLEKRTELVAGKITEFLEATDPFAKTIVFCEDIDHAERMRQALTNLNPERIAENRKYIMRITGDEQEGKAELDNFIDPEAATRSSPPPAS
jgi:type I restriction enzyme R subunit